VVRCLVLGVGSPADMLESSGSRSQDRLSLLKQKLAGLLQTDVDNVQIISITRAADEPDSVDVTFAAHGSPYYTPEKLNTLVWMNRHDVSSGLIFLYSTPCLEKNTHLCFFISPWKIFDLFIICLKMFTMKHVFHCR